jgi:hypothetical protein
MKTKILSFLVIAMFLTLGCGEPTYYSRAKIIKEGNVVGFAHFCASCLKQGDTVFLSNFNACEWQLKALPGAWMKDTFFITPVGTLVGTNDSTYFTVRRAVVLPGQATLNP